MSEQTKLKRLWWISVTPDKCVLKVKMFADRWWRDFYLVQKPGASCSCPLPICSISHHRIHCYFNPTDILAAQCLYRTTELTLLAEKSVMFILPTIENYFSHNFGPFILFITSRLLMNHPIHLCNLKEFTTGAYLLLFFFHYLYRSKYFSWSPNVSFLSWPIFVSLSFSIFPDFEVNPEDLCHILTWDIRNNFFCY